MFLLSYIAERFTQVMNSMPWVRCASGNVFLHFYYRLNFIACVLIPAMVFFQGNYSLKTLVNEDMIGARTQMRTGRRDILDTFSLLPES